jgi:hypothetical protein
MTTTPERGSDPDEGGEPGEAAEATLGDGLEELIADVEEAIEPLESTVDMTPLDHLHRLLLVHAHPDD